MKSLKNFFSEYLIKNKRVPSFDIFLTMNSENYSIKELGKIYNQLKKEPLDFPLIKKNFRKNPFILGTPGIFRFAPSLSGKIHIGNLKILILNELFREINGGRYLLRIEDTDPRKSKISLEDIERICSLLGISFDEKYIQSERIPIYLSFLHLLILKNRAFFCDCPSKKLKEMRKNKKLCIHYNFSLKKKLFYFQKFIKKEQKGVILFLCDIDSLNPAYRLLVIFRTSEKGITPLMNFSVAIDDYLMGVTHVIRGIDHENNDYKQRKILEALEISFFPKIISVGLVMNFKGIIGSSKNISDLSVEKILGKVTSNQIKNYWFEVGLSKNNSFFNFTKLKNMPLVKKYV